jgi:CBS domain containing-hemolysin-like protein
LTDPGTANGSGRSGDPIGYVHLKNVLRASDSQADAPVRAKRIHHPVPLNMTTDLEDALR